MPKMKSHRGAAKRFKVTGTGKIKHRRAFRNHKFEGKSSVRTRRLKPEQVVTDNDKGLVRRLLGL